MDNPQIDNAAIIRGLSQWLLLCQPDLMIFKLMTGTKREQLCNKTCCILPDASLFGPWFGPMSPLLREILDTVIPPQTAGGQSYTAHWQWGIGMPANAQNKDAA